MVFRYRPTRGNKPSNKGFVQIITNTTAKQNETAKVIFDSTMATVYVEYCGQSKQ